MQRCGTQTLINMQLPDKLAKQADMLNINTQTSTYEQQPTVHLTLLVAQIQTQTMTATQAFVQTLGTQTLTNMWPRATQTLLPYVHNFGTQTSADRLLDEA